nr:SWI/SNF related, matrix associated, actin dependent regulator of chromatin subfamily c member 1 [Myotis myotis]
MMPGQPLPGRMIPSVAASIHPPGSGPASAGMPPMPGSILGPRVTLTAPNGMYPPPQPPPADGVPPPPAPGPPAPAAP